MEIQTSSIGPDLTIKSSVTQLIEYCSEYFESDNHYYQMLFDIMNNEGCEILKDFAYQYFCNLGKSQHPIARLWNELPKAKPVIYRPSLCIDTKKLYDINFRFTFSEYFLDLFPDAKLICEIGHQINYNEGSNKTTLSSTLEMWINEFYPNAVLKGFGNVGGPIHKQLVTLARSHNAQSMVVHAPFNQSKPFWKKMGYDSPSWRLNLN